MKIFLFGSNGMLGRYVHHVLASNFIIIPINRNEYDVLSCDHNTLEKILKNANASYGDIIINCVGLIPQRNPNVKDLIKVNTLFPIALDKIANEFQLKFIHITTNCVFSGNTGNYDEDSEADSTELYGITKSLGEILENACILRTSIIGEEFENKLSLLEWVKQNKDGNIKGYTNFYWNGVTCLTLANIMNKMIHENIFWKGVKHICSPDIASKYQLCKWINETYQLNITVEEYAMDVPKCMTLSSKYLQVFDIKPIKTQIQDLLSVKL
jgi:dTDP-4-dehydrorhamnose reductase